MNVFLTAMGFAMMISIITLMLTRKMSPIIAMILVPVLVGVICGFSVSEISGFVDKGIASVYKNAIMFIFSVLFFGVMSDAGIFDAMVNVLTGSIKNNVTAVLLVTTVISFIGHLDGATVSTIMITIPAMLPIYRKLRIRPELLLFFLSITAGIMNLVSWGGAAARAATVIGVDANAIWVKLIPIQIVGLLLAVGFCFWFGHTEARRIALLPDTEEHDLARERGEREESARPKLLALNIFITLAVIVELVFSHIPAYLTFALGLAIAMVINFPSLKEQSERIMAHAGSAISICITMLAAGVMVGILNNSGMMEGMSLALISLVPSSLGQYIHVIFGLLAVPLGIVFGMDAFFYGLMPLIIGVAQNYGVSPMDVALALIIGKNVGVMLCPQVPATFMCVGMVDLEYGDHFKFSFKYLWLTSVIMLACGIVLGIVHL